MVINSVLYGADDVVGAYVLARMHKEGPDLRLDYDRSGNRMFAALGVVRHINGEPTLVGGLLGHQLNPACLEVSIACDSPRWISRTVLKQLFAYPFLQLGCSTVITRTRKGNWRARKLTKGLGFKLVGPIPHAFDGIEDLMLYAMTREQCRWIKD